LIQLIDSSLDKDPLQGLKGEVTKSAIYGWKIKLGEISESYAKIKLFQKTAELKKILIEPKIL